jgi:hypothetical protein
MKERTMLIPADFTTSPEAYSLGGILNEPLAWAYVVELWSWCSRMQPAGRFRVGMRAGVVEQIVGWRGEKEALYAAMMQIGFVREEGDEVVVPHMPDVLGSRMPEPKGEPLVYFVQKGETGPIKIGFTFRLHGRLKKLQTSSEERLHLRAAIPGNVALERTIHGMFAHYRLEGEWFAPSAELLEYIGGLGILEVP